MAGEGAAWPAGGKAVTTDSGQGNGPSLLGMNWLQHVTIPQLEGDQESHTIPKFKELRSWGTPGEI